jgi:hypothetical protein
VSVVGDPVRDLSSWVLPATAFAAFGSDGNNRQVDPSQQYA